MKKCPLSFPNPNGPTECIKEGCPLWKADYEYDDYVHPDYYRSKQPNPLPLDFEKTVRVLVPAHCSKFGDMR